MHPEHVSMFALRTKSITMTPIYVQHVQEVLFLCVLLLDCNISFICTKWKCEMGKYPATKSHLTLQQVRDSNQSLLLYTDWFLCLFHANEGVSSNKKCVKLWLRPWLRRLRGRSLIWGSVIQSPTPAVSVSKRLWARYYTQNGPWRQAEPWIVFYF